MLRQERPHLVSVHIEKTAGTTLQEYLVSLFGPEKVLQYLPNSGEFTRNSDISFNPTNLIVDFIKRTISKSKIRPFLAKLYGMTTSGVLNPNVIKIIDLPQTEYAALHGHFVANQFEGFVSNPIYAVLLRDPLSRMISHYTNWQRAHGQSPWRIQVPYNQCCSFEEFALLPQLKNYQTQALGSISIDDFTFVGAVEKLNTYLASMYIQLKAMDIVSSRIDSGVVRYYNRTPQKPVYALEQSFVAAFKQFHADDYALHEYALGRS